ncbi:hypothetical protein [Streptomyces termitum]
MADQPFWAARLYGLRAATRYGKRAVRYEATVLVAVLDEWL